MLKLSPFRAMPWQRNDSTPPPTHFSLLDIGADTIKAAVIRVEAGTVQVLGHSLASTQNRDVTGSRAQAAALTIAVNAALQEAEDATEATAGRKIVPDHTLFLLPGKTLQGGLFTVKHRRVEADQPLSQKEFDTVWNRAVRLAKQGLSALPGVGADWIPQTITPAHIQLDGHWVNDPLGLKGKTLSLSVYGMICQPDVIEAIGQLARRLEVEIYRLVPAPQALATIVPSRDALLFDVGSSGTDFAFIQHDALIVVGRIALGGNFFTGVLADAFQCDTTAAEALKIAFASGTLPRNDVLLVQRSLQQPLQRWADEITASAAKILPAGFGTQLPGKLFFTGGSAVLPGLKNQLLSGLPGAGFTFDRAPQAVNLGETPLTGFTGEPTGFRGILFAPVLSLARTV